MTLSVGNDFLMCRPSTSIRYLAKNVGREIQTLFPTSLDSPAPIYIVCVDSKRMSFPSRGLLRTRSSTLIADMIPALHSLDLGQAFLELGPVVHDNLGAVADEHVGHLLRLRRVVVAADVGDCVDPRADGTQCSALAVLHCDALARLDADLLAGKQVDRRVGLGGGLRQRGRRTEDMVLGEVLRLVDLLHRRHYPAQRRRRHHRHPVLLALVQLLQLLVGADTRLRLLLQGLDHAVLLLLDVALTLLVGELEAVLRLHAGDDAAEVLPHEVLHQLRAGVARGFAMFGEDLVGELGTGFEGEFFGEDERVVAVEEEFDDLEAGLVSDWGSLDFRDGGGYLRHCEAGRSSSGGIECKVCIYIGSRCEEMKSYIAEEKHTNI